MEDREIIKALTICSTKGASCKDCPAFVKVDRSNCKKVLLGAIDLINRLQAQNEVYETCNARKDEAIKSLESRLKKLQMQFGDIGKMYSEIKAEAYKEFAERLKEKPTQYFYETNRDMTIPLVSFDRIDNLLKELVGEE